MAIGALMRSTVAPLASRYSTGSRPGASSAMRLAMAAGATPSKTSHRRRPRRKAAAATSWGQPKRKVTGSPRGAMRPGVGTGSGGGGLS